MDGTVPCRQETETQAHPGGAGHYFSYKQGCPDHHSPSPRMHRDGWDLGQIEMLFFIFFYQ